MQAQKETKRPVIAADKEAALHGYATIVHPLVTEKAINMIDSENKLVFVVNKNSSKPQIKKAVEELYGVKVVDVNVLVDSKSRKKAFVRISKEFKASELATKLGVL